MANFNNNQNNNNNQPPNPYRLELQKIDLMISMWKEINKFSNRVLDLHINHRQTVYNQMHGISSSTNINHSNNQSNSRALSNGHSGHQRQHHRRRDRQRSSSRSSHHRYNRVSTGNETVSDSVYDEDDHEDDHEDEESDSMNGYGGDDSDYRSKSNKSTSCQNGTSSSSNSHKKERRTTKGRCSGYNIYFGVRCKEIQKNEPDLEFATISKNIGNEWKNLSKAEQKKWNEIAAKMTKQRREEALKKEQMAKQLQIKQERKRALLEMNGGANHNMMNGMVSNVRIEDRNQMQMKRSLEQPPMKRARLNGHHGNNLLLNNLNRNTGVRNGALLPLLNAGSLRILPSSTSAIPNMSGPALSLINEALKKMPPLQPASKVNAINE